MENMENNFEQMPNENSNNYYYQKSNSYSPIGFSVASMVLGIVALVFNCVTIISLICSVIAIALGGHSLKSEYRGRGMAIAGLVCGIIALVLVVITYIISISIGLSFSEFLGSLL